MEKYSKLLFVFPVKIENPYPVKLKSGEAVKFDKLRYLLFAGNGEFGAQNLETVLKLGNFDAVIEFGGAAAVKNAATGDIFSVETAFNTDFTESFKLKTVDFLPLANSFSGNFIFEKDEAVISENFSDLPLIFDMETFLFADVCRKQNKDFFSIRLVTDDGTGNIKESYIKTIEKYRSDVKKIFEKFLDVYSSV